jgi:Nif-specific regulatory protein
LLAAPVFDPAAVRRSRAEVVGVILLVNRKGGFTPALEERLSDLAVDIAGLLFRTSLRYDLRSETRQPLVWGLSHVVGAGPKLRTAVGRILRASRTDVSVLIRGETGTGKDLLARALHASSPRRHGPLVKVDCSALPVDLIENELFGHERGAFKGAGAGREGRVAAAEGGTLFLDEIGDLPLSIQGKLLRLVQDRTYHRLGGHELHKADVRFVTSTRRNLEEDVRSGLFRRDLYFRLRVVEVRLLPLRERSRADLDRLIDYSLRRFGELHSRPGLRLSEPARETLLAHTWPGNIRELENCLEAAVVLTDGPKVQPMDLPLVDPRTLGMPVIETSISQLIEEDEPVATLREVEDRWIREVLDGAGGNRTKAAEILGIGRNTLLRRLRNTVIDELEPEDTLPP